MPETSDLRVATRRLKKKALEIAEGILNDSTHPLYNETFLAVIKNTVPRTQEITGEDGEAVQIKLVSYADNSRVIQSTDLPSGIIESV